MLSLCKSKGMDPPTANPPASSSSGPPAEVTAEDPDEAEAARLEMLLQLDPGQIFRQDVYFKA